MGPQSANDGGRGGAKDGAGWQVGGWVRWLEGLRGNYERRMQTMCTILEDGKYLVKSGRRQSLPDDEWSVVEKTQLYDFIWPLGGMFIWLQLNLKSHPLFKKTTPEKLARALWIHLTTKPYLVLVSPGTIFSPTDVIKKEKGWDFFRLCFAAVDEPDVEDTSLRFVDGVRAFWGKKSLDDIEEDVVWGEDEERSTTGGCC